MLCCENVVSICVSRAGGSLQGLTTRSECHCVPVGPGEPVGVMSFMLNWLTNPTNMTVNILKGITWHFDFQSAFSFFFLCVCVSQTFVVWESEVLNIISQHYWLRLLQIIIAVGGKDDTKLSTQPWFLNLPSFIYTTSKIASTLMTMWGLWIRFSRLE